MSRWSQYEEDDDRLPEGLRRIGYDSDTQTYSFEDTSDGSIWESSPGNRYGELHLVSGPPQRQASHQHFHEDEGGIRSGPAARRRRPSSSSGNNKMEGNSDWRYFAPFLLLIALVLLLVFKAMGAQFLPSSTAAAKPAPAAAAAAKAGYGPNTGPVRPHGAPQRIRPTLGVGSRLDIVPTCGDGQEQYTIRRGDSCWSIAEQRLMSLYQLKKMNKGINCEKLLPEAIICVVDGTSDDD